MNHQVSRIEGIAFMFKLEEEENGIVDFMAIKINYTNLLSVITYFSLVKTQINCVSLLFDLLHFNIEKCHKNC